MTTSPRLLDTTLVAADHQALAAKRYLPAGTIKAKLLVAGATGVPQGFYRRFAQFACEQGLEVMTLDYRGIGLSRPKSLRGFKVNYLDWARLDLAAAVDALTEHNDLPLYLVGHSYGGHALGLLPNHHKVTRAYFVATGAGWHGWMPWFESLKVRLLWNWVLPPLTALKGYSPWSMLGMGQDLPKEVFYQWRHWCTYPHYFFDAPDMAYLKAQYASVTTPIMAANALDDLWALPQSRDAFIKAYSQAP